MSDMNSGVSVLMTAFNGMPYLQPAVESILNQTFDDFEFIIVNDGSTEESTREYLDSITDPRVRVFHEPNRGTAGGSNFGLQHCTRKYVARMDADDISLPTRLAEQYEFMQANADVSLVGTQLRIIGEENLGIEVQMPTDHDSIYSALLTLDHGMNHGSCFYRNELIKKIGGYWDVHKFHDDWDMFLRMGEVGRLANLPKILFHYRTLPSSLVGSRWREMREYFQYSVDCANRRAAGQAERSPEEFFETLAKRPWLTRATESLGIYSLAQYRIATAEICAQQKVRGYSRLAWAAICSPKRTLNRVARILSLGTAKKKLAQTE